MMVETSGPSPLGNIPASTKDPVSPYRLSIGWEASLEQISESERVEALASAGPSESCSIRCA